MVYGVFRFINFAHGELIAWGAYLALLFTQTLFSLPIYYAVLPALCYSHLCVQEGKRQIYNLIEPMI